MVNWYLWLIGGWHWQMPIREKFMANSFCKFIRGHSKDGSTNRVVKLKCEIYVPIVKFQPVTAQPPRRILQPDPRQNPSTQSKKGPWGNHQPQLLMAMQGHAVDGAMGWDGRGFCSYSSRDVHQQARQIQYCKRLLGDSDVPRVFV